jgi:hypothetical protein
MYGLVAVVLLLFLLGMFKARQCAGGRGPYCEAFDFVPFILCYFLRVVV